MEIIPRRLRNIMWFLLYFCCALWVAGFGAAEFGIIPNYGIFVDEKNNFPSWANGLFTIIFVPLFGWGAITSWQNSFGKITAKLTTKGVLSPDGNMFKWDKDINFLVMKEDKIRIDCVSANNHEVVFVLEVDGEKFNKQDIKNISEYIRKNAPMNLVGDALHRSKMMKKGSKSI